MIVLNLILVEEFLRQRLASSNTQVSSPDDDTTDFTSQMSTVAPSAVFSAITDHSTVPSVVISTTDPSGAYSDLAPSAVLSNMSSG